MTKEKSLIEVANEKKGLKKIINNIVELIKSRTNKNYVLSVNSPDFLKQNKNLILKTIKKDFKYLDYVPDNILLEELQQFPIDGIIDTAFKHGYTLGKSSPNILIGENAKTAILQYIKIQKNDKINNFFGRNSSELQWKISYLLDNLDENLFLDIDFREKMLDLVIEKGFKLTKSSPTCFKQNAILAENYYTDLLENNIDGLLSDNILTPELLSNRIFLQNYINLLLKKGIDTDIIIKTLTSNKDCINVLKKDLELFQSIFEQISPTNLENFFNTFFSKEELTQILNNKENLRGKLLKISQLYTKDQTILESLDSKLLEKPYQDIPNYKMQLIAKIPEIQDNLLQLNDYEYSLYSKMTDLVSQKTDRWNRFENCIITNLSNSSYEELINDLYEQAKQGNKITAKDIETLTFLLSKQDSFDSNIFSITTKNELQNFEEIKELVCDTVLTNPSLDDIQLTTPISKYLSQFKQLSELDRIKLALLEKYYNMDLKEASNIVTNFSVDINNIVVNNTYQASIVEQVKAIKNIFECNDITTLNQISNLDILVETDLSTSTYLIEQAKELFEQEYKRDLYVPENNKKIGHTTYDGKNIEVFDADTNFSMIIKAISDRNKNSQEIWNTLTSDGEKKKNLRYHTCTSYMTDENILKLSKSNLEESVPVILGFSQGINDFSFDGIFPCDIHSPMQDKLYYDSSESSYVLPSTLETNTDNSYNEIVINTLKIDSHGQLTKLQPDYIVYIKDQNNIDSLENNPMWEKSKKVASEFEIPIVIVDVEKIKESEKTKISNMSKELSNPQTSNEALKFIKKVEHYTSRYGSKDILEYASEDTINSLEQYVEQKQQEEKENISVPRIDTDYIVEQPINNRQKILEKQTILKEKNIITGEDER